VLLRPLNVHRHHEPPNQHCHRGVLQRSRQSFWALFPENCPWLFCSDSHLDAASFDPTWMHWQMGDTTGPPRASISPLQTTGLPDCWDSSDSLGTVLSQTVASVRCCSMAFPSILRNRWAALTARVSRSTISCMNACLPRALLASTDRIHSNSHMNKH